MEKYYVSHISKLKDWNYTNGEISNIGPFFNYDDAKIQFLSCKPQYEDASQATWWAAHHTYFGEAVGGYYNLDTSKQPYRTDYKVIDASLMELEGLPDGFDTEIVKKDQRRYDYWDQMPSGYDKDYMIAIQHHLNVGVYYCAGVMNHVKNSYVKCEVGIEKELTQTIERLVAEYAFLWMMAGLGNIALVVVLAQSAISGALSGDSILKALGIIY